MRMKKVIKLPIQAGTTHTHTPQAQAYTSTLVGIIRVILTDQGVTKSKMTVLGHLQENRC